MISVIIPEHQQDQRFIVPLLEQIRHIPNPKEVIIVSSSSYFDIPIAYEYPIYIVPDIVGTGEARNAGAKHAKGDILIYTDCHCCFKPKDITTMLTILKQYPDAVIVPGIQPYHFPVCSPVHSGVGYGLYYDLGMGLHWLGHPGTNKPTPIPTQMTTFLVMHKQTFEDSIFGFIEVGSIGFDEEIEIRLWRFGHPTLVVPDVIVGHYFKPKRTDVTEETPHLAQAIALILNVFDDELFDKINRTCYERRGGEQWNTAMEVAYEKYGWARNIIKEKEINKINEHWFFTEEK